MGARRKPLERPYKERTEIIQRIRVELLEAVREKVAKSLEGSSYPAEVKKSRGREGNVRPTASIYLGTTCCRF